jgi:hypothetical protein
MKAYIFLRVVRIESGAIFHKYASDNVSPVQSDFNIVLIVQAHIGKDSDDGADHVRVRPVRICLKHV